MNVTALATPPEVFPASPASFPLPGPAGVLEVWTDVAAGEARAGTAVICHPHPLHGGTLHNKVVTTLERSLRELGLDTVRFNFRGVGASAGAFDEGIGETEDLAAVAAFAADLGPGARVLEIGSAGGRDAGLLEDAGLSVRRTDVSPGFVALMRADGQDADLLDPLTDDLDDPARPGTPYDGVWASASLLHVDRHDLPTVLARLAGATRPGGLLRLWVKEGDGAAWSRHGHVAGVRRFTFWRPEPLAEVLADAGWEVIDLRHVDSTVSAEPWLDVTARRPA